MYTEKIYKNKNLMAQSHLIVTQYSIYSIFKCHTQVGHLKQLYIEAIRVQTELQTTSMAHIGLTAFNLMSLESDQQQTRNIQTQLLSFPVHL